MKKIITTLAFGLLFIGCANREMDYIFTIPNSEAAKVSPQCKSSCVIDGIQFQDIIVPSQDTASMIGLIGDTLRTYVYHLEDGREGILEKEEYDTLTIGDILGSCKVLEISQDCSSKK